MLRRHLLDLDSAFRAGHHHVAGEAAIERNPEVELAGDVHALFDVDLAHFLALRPGLVRDQLHAHHFAEDLARLLRRFGELHAAALAAAAGVDLRLDDDAAAELLRRQARLLGVVDDDAARRRHAVAAQDFLGLIFVDFHGARRFITSTARRVFA